MLQNDLILETVINISVKHVMVSKSILNHYYIVQHVQRGRSVMTFKVLMRSILGH